MKRELFLRYLIATFTIVLIGWIGLTIYVERPGPSKQWILGNSNHKSALIVYDPDPFYNLDEKVCKSFGQALAEQDMLVNVVTVAAADTLKQRPYDVIVYCANTYNWQPDWSMTNYIEDHQPSQENKSIVAITLGAGSTGVSQKTFEQTIINSGGTLIKSYSLWLWHPNDKTKMEEPNVEVAVAMAYDWGKQIALKTK